MGDDQNSATERPDKKKPEPKPLVEDPRDDLREKVAKHREQLQNFYTSKLTGLAREGASKRQGPSRK